jgi:uncharacterized protein with von Willebrand factor type A (vWA) domain
MKKTALPELTRTISRQTHMLAMLSAASIRQELEVQARAMLKAVKSVDETIDLIRLTGLADIGKRH